MSQQINLFDPIFLKQEKYFSAATMGIALSVIALACGALIGYGSYNVKKVDRESLANQANMKVGQDQLKKLEADSKARVKSAEVEDALRSTQVELEALQRVKYVLDRGDFGTTQGFAEYLRAFARQSIDGLWLTGFALSNGGMQVALQGRALQPELIPAYVGRLKRENVMGGKSFSAIDVHAGDSKKLPAEIRSVPNLPKYVEFELKSEAPEPEAPPQGGKPQ